MAYMQTFTVEGQFDFPFDMLRYDQCWPASESDSAKLHPEPANRPRLERVKLKRHVSQKADLPTVRRWESFGWQVWPKSVNTIKC